jgi:hypothetical protein
MKLSDKLGNFFLNNFENAYSILGYSLCSFGLGKLFYDVAMNNNQMEGMAEIICGGASYLVFQKINEELVIPLREKKETIQFKNSFDNIKKRR